jgi:hypothetical protein
MSGVSSLKRAFAEKVTCWLAGGKSRILRVAERI